MYTVADISTSRLTDEDVDALIAAGVQCMIVGVRESDPDLTMHNLVVAQLFPRRPDIYVYPCWSRPVGGRIRRAIDRYVGLYDRLWLDCEDNGDGEPGIPPQSADTIIRLIDEGIQVCEQENQLVGYYSGAWWHVPATGNYTGWSHIPLWTADYDGVAELDKWTPYGGWTRPAAKQYAAGITIGGVLVDLSVMEDV